MKGEQEENTLNELVSFLSHSRPEIRKSAVSLVVGLSGNNDSIRNLVKFDIIKPLCRMVSDMRSIAQDVLKILVNITAIDPNNITIALKYDIINRLMNQMDESDWELKDLAIMLLANVTTTKEGGQKFLDDGRSKDNSPGTHKYLANLTNQFLDTEPEPAGLDDVTDEPKWDDDHQYVANIWANITQLEDGRKLLLKINNKLLPGLIKHIRSPNVIRRRGIVNTIRNLCFSTENHFYLYDELDICPKLLYNLAGPEPLSDDDKEGMCPSLYRLGDKKKRELDVSVRLSTIETLLLLCTTRNGRNVLRSKKAYPIIRDAHLVEADEKISEQIYQLVNFLMSDEEGEEPDWKEIRREAFTSDDKSKEEEETFDMDTTCKPVDVPSEKALDCVEKEQEVVPVLKKEDEPTHVNQVSETTTISKDVDEFDEEDIPLNVADALAKEIDLLDCSSDEEDSSVQLE